MVVLSNCMNQDQDNRNRNWNWNFFSLLKRLKEIDLQIKSLKSVFFIFTKVLIIFILVQC